MAKLSTSQRNFFLQEIDRLVRPKMNEIGPCKNGERTPKEYAELVRKGAVKMNLEVLADRILTGREYTYHFDFMTWPEEDKATVKAREKEESVRKARIDKLNELQHQAQVYATFGNDGAEILKFLQQLKEDISKV